MKTKKSLKISIIVFFNILFIFNITWGRDVTIDPRISLQEMYDTNVTFDRLDKKDDFITTINPSLYFGYNTEISRLSTLLRSGLNNYATETDLNYQTYDGKLNFNSQLMELLSIELGGLFISDTTLESELEETGRKRLREKRLRYDYYSAIGVDITELTELKFSYKYRNVDFETEKNDDYNLDVFSFDLIRALTNEIDSIHLNMIYTLEESKLSESDNYSVGLKWSRTLSDTFNFYMLGGYRWTEEYTSEREKEHNQGIIIDIGIAKEWDRTALNLAYVRDLVYSGGGENLNVDRLQLDVKRSISVRLMFDVNARYYLTVGDIENDNEDSQYYEIKTKFTYNLTERHRLVAGYRFSLIEDNTVEQNKENDRNRVWISVVFAFPKKL